MSERVQAAVMKDLAVAVVVLSVALALVICCFAAAALVVGQKLRRLEATSDNQFLLRGNSVRAAGVTLMTLARNGFAVIRRSRLERMLRCMRDHAA